MFLSPNVIMSKFSNTGFKKTKRHKYKKQKRRRTRRHYLKGGWGEPFVLGGYDKKFKHLDTHEDIGMKGVMKGVMKGGWGQAPPMI